MNPANLSNKLIFMELPIDAGAFPLSLKISPFNAIGFTKVDPMEIILRRGRCGCFAYSVAPTKAKGVNRFRVLSLSRDASLHGATCRTRPAPELSLPAQSRLHPRMR